MSVELAHDGYVATPDGPVLVPELSAGSGVLAIVGGVTTEIAVSEVGDTSNADVVRLLTAVGDVVIPANEYVITRDGPLRADAVAAELRRGREPRLEVMNPVDLPRGAGRSSSRIGSVSSFVRTLDPPIIRLPAPVADEGTAEAVDAILTRTGVQFERTEDDRWTVFVLEAMPEAPSRARNSDTAEILLSLTAWGLEGGSLVSRTLLEATRTRRQLIAALVEAQTPFEAKWTPGYLPVECRIRRPPDGRWRPFVAVTGALSERRPTMRLETSRPGSLVIGLAVSGPLA